MKVYAYLKIKDIWQLCPQQFFENNSVENMTNKFNSPKELWEYFHKRLEKFNKNCLHENFKINGITNLIVFGSDITSKELNEAVSSDILREKKNTVYLMHKNDIICKYKTTNIIENCELLEVYNKDLMPVGTIIDEKISEHQFSQWLKWRSIPYSRKNMKLILQTLNLTSTEFMIRSCNGASLNDLYWYKEENSDLTWEDINFYDNEWFKEDSKLLFLKLKKGTSKQYLNTPDCVSIGNQPKCWIRENGHNYLLKADKSPVAMEAFTEEFYYLLTLNTNSFPYTFYEDKQNEICCSKTLNFMEQFKNCDFITAGWYMQQFDYINDRQYLELLIDEISSMGENSINKFISMLVFDYLYLNSDRHLDNFGFIRSEGTPTFSKIYQMAPIFDNGDSFSRNCKPQECQCYLLKDWTNNVDEIISIIRPYIKKNLINNVIKSYNNFYSIEKTLEEKYRSYNISEFLDKKPSIFDEIKRRYDILLTID